MASRPTSQMKIVTSDDDSLACIRLTSEKLQETNKIYFSYILDVVERFLMLKKYPAHTDYFTEGERLKYADIVKTWLHLIDQLYRRLDFM